MVNLNFINEIINSHIQGYKTDRESNFIDIDEERYKIEALEVLRESIKTFIKDTNKLPVTIFSGYHE